MLAADLRSERLLEPLDHVLMVQAVVAVRAAGLDDLRDQLELAPVDPVRPGPFCGQRFGAHGRTAVNRQLLTLDRRAHDSASTMRLTSSISSRTIVS